MLAETQIDEVMGKQSGRIRLIGDAVIAQKLSRCYGAADENQVRAKTNSVADRPRARRHRR